MDGGERWAAARTPTSGSRSGCWSCLWPRRRSGCGAAIGAGSRACASSAATTCAGWITKCVPSAVRPHPGPPPQSRRRELRVRRRSAESGVGRDRCCERGPAVALTSRESDASPSWATHLPGLRSALSRPARSRRVSRVREWMNSSLTLRARLGRVCTFARGRGIRTSQPAS